MKTLNWLLGGIVLLFSSCVSTNLKNYSFNKKQPNNLLLKDVELLENILKANHPSLYWYTSEDSINYYFNAAKEKIKQTDSLTETAFKNIVAEVVSKIKCGHTSVQFSKQYNKQAVKYRYPSFPLLLKVWADSMVVLRNLHNDSILKRGTIITGINQYSNRQIVDSIFNFITTDGNANNFKYQVISNNFPLWYKNIFGLDSIYTIHYIDSAGIAATTTIKNYYLPKPDSTKKDSSQPVQEKLTRREKKQLQLLEKRSLQIDTSINTAYIRLNSFSNGRLRKFFKQVYKKIEQDKIENVVIDLRQNGGGSVGITTKLLKYFAHQPFKHADTVAAKTRNLKYKKYIKDWQWYWLPMHLFTQKQRDELIHYTRFEKHYFTPHKYKNFKGNLFIVQGGITFSASTMFINALQKQANVTVVGEETGGGQYGNSAMHLPQIILPNSKLKIILPLYRVVINKNNIKGRGIIPNVYIPPSSAAIKAGYDNKLLAIREMILSKKKQTFKE